MLRKNCLQKTSTNGHVNTDVVNQTQDLFTSSQRQKDVSFEKSPLLHFNLQEWIRAREIYHEQNGNAQKPTAAIYHRTDAAVLKKGMFIN